MDLRVSVILGLMELLPLQQGGVVALEEDWDCVVLSCSFE